MENRTRIKPEMREKRKTTREKLNRESFEINVDFGLKKPCLHVKNSTDKQID